MLRRCLCLSFSSLMLISFSLQAESISNEPPPVQTVVTEKIEYERSDDANPFTFTAYEPNYFLPFNYTFSPARIYNNNAPASQKIQRTDVKFQFSLKTPVWRNVGGYCNTLYLAYTQQSFWQAYNKSAFFRANNYQPEVFLENNIDTVMPFGWCFQLFNVGAMHQSNGRGGFWERTWDRIYMEAIFSKDNWVIAFKPWYIIRSKELIKHNPDIGHYLGYARTLIACKFNEQVLSLSFQNMLESGFKRGSIQINYSFPLINKLRGYVQFFNGYGQSLIEYNHSSAAFGIGLSLSDWL